MELIYANFQAPAGEVRYASEADITEDIGRIFGSGVSTPVPLPLLPNGGGEQSALPFFGDAPTPRPADDEDEPLCQTLLNAAYEKDFVQAAKAIAAGDEILVVVLTAPFYLKSERDGARVALEKELEEIAGGIDVTVSYDMELFRKMDDSLDEEQKAQLLAIAKARI